MPLQFGSSSHSICTCLLKISQFNKRKSNKQEFDTRLCKKNDNSNNCPIVSVCSIIRLRHSVCVCVLKLLQCVFRVSYLHSHALCSVKLMNTSFCCFRRFNLFICWKKRTKKITWLTGGSKRDMAKLCTFTWLHKLSGIFCAIHCWSLERNGVIW